MQEANNDTLTAIDLCGGAGGLTLGLKRAGFKVLVAVEVNPKYAKTYQTNHKDTKLVIRDIREVTGREILEIAGVDNIDLVAGCPPCQGFSSLTRKYKRHDPRNELMLEMARIIEEIEPWMVMMENVPGVVKRGKPILDKFKARLETRDYKINYRILQLADYGIPQSRRRFVLLAGKGFYISIPEGTHCSNGATERKLKSWLKLSEVIKERGKPVTLSTALKNRGPQRFNWHVVRDLKELSLRRLAAINEGDSRQALPKELRPNCHADSDKGFTNVYGRLSWDRIPPTITSGCTTPAMGRFGHPDELRTISVREAATIQTFPKKYVIATEHMDTACELIGNALPPKFAQKAANWCKKTLISQYNVRN